MVSQDIKLATIYKKIHCKGYTLTESVKKFVTNLVSFLCNIKNYDVSKIKSISIRVNEIDNTIHIKIYFEDFISHIPITKPIFIIRLRNKKILDFLKNKKERIFTN